MEKKNQQEKTYIEQVADMLNVKIKEEFLINIDKNLLSSLFRLNTNGLEIKRISTSQWELASKEIFNGILIGEYLILKLPKEEFKVGDKFKLNDRLEIQSCTEGVVYLIKKDNRVHINLTCIIDEIHNKLYRVKCDNIQLASKPLFLYFTKEELSNLKRL